MSINNLYDYYICKSKCNNKNNLENRCCLNCKENNICKSKCSKKSSKCENSTGVIEYQK